MNAEGYLVLCPFYKNHEASRLMCEGIDDNCRNGLWFNSKENLKKYMNSFCKKDYKSCMIYRMLDEKYG